MFRGFPAYAVTLNGTAEPVCFIMFGMNDNENPHQLTIHNEPQSLRELLETRVESTPDKNFLFSESDRRSFTYREFDETVNRTANMLLSHGVGKGDTVSLLMPNSVEYIVAYFACFKIGALAGPVN
jgi:acyl-CoA synthetase (AMP-forming)/AMP-acid ligase II